MSDVILAIHYGSPKSFDFLIPNLAPALLSAILERAGHETDVYDLNLPGNSFKSLLERIRKTKPCLVGMTLYHNAFLDMLDLARGIKKDNPNVKIAAGGPEVTYFEENIYKRVKGSEVFDVLVSGEGENAILSLMEWISGEKRIDDVEGAIYVKDGDVRKNERDFADVNSSPLPGWDSLELDRYLPILPLELGRGCIWASQKAGGCRFCIIGHISGKRREKSRETVSRELYHGLRQGVTAFRIADSSASYERLEMFSDIVLEKDLKIKWSTLGRVEGIHERVLSEMKKSGCVSVFFGTESGSDRILKAMNKGTTREQNIRAIRAAKRAGLKVAVSNIIGFPGETDETIAGTISMIKETLPDSAMVYPLGILPNTDLANCHEKYGLSLHEDWIEKNLGTKIVLVDGRPTPTHYFNYADGKPNTYYWKKAFEVGRKLAKFLILRGKSIQIPDHAFLLSEMTRPTLSDRFWNLVRVRGSRAQRVVRKVAKLLDG